MGTLKYVKLTEEERDLNFFEFSDFVKQAGGIEMASRILGVSKSSIYGFFRNQRVTSAKVMDKVFRLKKEKDAVIYSTWKELYDDDFRTIVERFLLFDKANALNITSSELWDNHVSDKVKEIASKNFFHLADIPMLVVNLGGNVAFWSKVYCSLVNQREIKNGRKNY